MQMLRLITAMSVAIFATASAASSETIRVPVRVTDVSANVENVNFREPYEQCKNVEVPIYGRQEGNDDLGSFLGGAIIGGIIGKGATGNDGGAAVGALLGGALANESQKNNGQDVIVGYRSETRCTTKYRTRQERQIIDYTISYQLGDREFRRRVNTKLNRGDWITLNLDVQSVVIGRARN